MVFAQNQPASSAEDVAIAFFKTGDTNPNYDLWAKNSRDYKVAAPALADIALNEEKQRLMKKWQAFNKNESMISVLGPVNIQLKAVKSNDDDIEYKMSLVFPQGNATYFPYKFMDYDFAVIPQKIETFASHTITKEQFDLIFQTLHNKAAGSAFISMQLRPVKAYMSEPHSIDGKDQWALICNVASLAVLAPKTRRALWSKTADWYVSPATQGLQDLYHAPAESGQPTAP